MVENSIFTHYNINVSNTNKMKNAPWSGPTLKNEFVDKHFILSRRLTSVLPKSCKQKVAKILKISKDLHQRLYKSQKYLQESSKNLAKTGSTVFYNSKKVTKFQSQVVSIGWNSCFLLCFSSTYVIENCFVRLYP